MALWTLANNITLREVEEGQTLRPAKTGENRSAGLLPIDLGVITGSTISIISGSLPPGLRIKEGTLQGTPLEVARETDFKFVLRASKDGNIEDRTYNVSVKGADQPIWGTTAGSLPIGNNETYYILDSAPIDFQLIATDTDTEAGETLEYFIASGDGELPPGIQLTRDGRIVGVVDPVLALDKAAQQGFYDDSPYGAFPFDFGTRPANGYDSFYYDIEFYDKSVATKSPKKLNRNYQFRVSVSDGDTIQKRLFRIYVVGDDFLRSDNTIMQSGNTLFGADATFVRTPIWLTPADLGYRRADNYVTLYLDTIDASNTLGFITYALKDTNDDGSQSSIPPGMTLDTGTGELAGIVPYQPNVTKEYKFTVTATRYVGPATNTEDLSFEVYETTYPQNRTPATKMKAGKNYEIVSVYGTTDYTTVGAANNNIGTIFTSSGPTSGTNESLVKQAGGAYTLRIKKSPYLAKLKGKTFNLKGTLYTVSEINNASYLFDVLIFTKALDARLNVDETFTTTVTIPGKEDTNSSPKDKTFTVKLLGKIDSTLNWISPKALGTINANLTSTFSINATTSVQGANVRYIKEEGRLPPGLSLALDGEIFGKVQQFGENRYKSFWKTNRAYVSDDIVKVGSTKYKCLIAHTSQAEFISDTAKWEVYAGFAVSGLTTFDSNDMLFDGNTTSIDKTYTFKTRAEDQYGFSAIRRNFTIVINDPNDLVFSNIIVKAFLGSQQKFLYNSFISDPIVFDPEKIYRPNDTGFGTQSDLKMLMYAGIETVDMNKFVAAAAKNHKRKQFKFGSIKKAVAYELGTKIPVYEVVYIEVIDPQDHSSGNVQSTLKVKSKIDRTINSIQYETLDNTSGVVDNSPIRQRPITNTLKIDSDAIKVDEDKQQQKYISNITNMRNRIAAVGETDNNFLPLWMRTPQENNIEALGYTPAVVLTYCKPGTADEILLNIKNSAFDFKSINFEVDRYIIDSTRGNSNDQYILFANYDFNV